MAAANSFSVLLSYIDNFLWLCTQVFCGIVYAIEFNYKLVTSIFQGCVQLWGMSIQAVIGLGNGFVSTIEFLAELPVRTFHLGKYLLELFTTLMHEAGQAGMSMCWTALTFCMKTLTGTFQNLGGMLVSAWTQMFHSLSFYYGHFANNLSFLKNTTTDHVSNAMATTVDVVQSVGTNLQESVLRFCNTFIEIVVAGLTYPVALWNTSMEGVTEGMHIITGILNSIGDSLSRVLEDIIQIVHSISSSITNGLHDILDALKEIAMFPVHVIDYISATIAAVLDSVADGYSSLSLFVVKNWGALLALALCVTLVWVTIYLTGQHERNIQHIIRDLTRLVNSFTHSRPREVPREPMRPEGHLQDGIQPQGQQQGQPEGQHEGHPEGQHEGHLRNRNNDANRELGVGGVGGGDDQPGPSRARHTPHTSYSLRSRPFTPTGESSNGSVESTLSDLKNRLSAEHERQMCVVCLDSEKNTLFLPCRHLCVCSPCADTIISNADIHFRQCPLCRKKIGSIVEVYH